MQLLLARLQLLFQSMLRHEVLSLHISFCSNTKQDQPVRHVRFVFNFPELSTTNSDHTCVFKIAQGGKCFSMRLAQQLEIQSCLVQQLLMS
jgi:hypothetical protein